jgi:hypothetical protein
MKRSHILGALVLCAPLGVAVTAAQSLSQGAGDPAAPAARHAVTAAVTPEVFCSFLPPKPGGNIGNSESDAVVFCNKASSEAPDANIFPSGFIKTAHFAEGEGFVQYTGRIDREAYKLSAKDGGGQFDSNGSPPGARVSGAKKFVNLVEPDVQHWCIRACTDPGKCNTGDSQAGCEVVIPGDYH